jgi:hypothetical protein
MIEMIGIDIKCLEQIETRRFKLETKMMNAGCHREEGKDITGKKHLCLGMVQQRCVMVWYMDCAAGPNTTPTRDLLSLEARRHPALLTLKNWLYRHDLTLI